MRLSDAARLLDPAPLALEMGYERLDDGVLHVAIRTDLHRCTGAMLEWWFNFRPTTREYVWWHPLDHVSSSWTDVAAGTHVGSVHLVEERFTAQEVVALSIQFRDPHEIFAADDLAQAKARGDVSAVICARGGAGHQARRTQAGEVIGTRLLHVCRDTGWGAVLRTHFFMGQDMPGLGMPPHGIAEMFPERNAPGLIQHCYDEFTTLSGFLPALHAAEGGAGGSFVRPW